ncbi:MAG: hypothetical protein ACQEXJ_02930 [Myxococcota bacterium]
MKAAAPALAVACCLLAAGCRDAPEEKVKRWATEVWHPEEEPAVDGDTGPTPPGDGEGDAEAREAPPEPEQQQVKSSAGPDASGEAEGCERLSEEACSWLGPHTEECLEARQILPSSRTPEQEVACAKVLEEHADLIEGAPDGFPGMNPCGRLARRQCRDLGARTWACKEARSDASRLRWMRREEVCLGDLLLWEARAVLSDPAGGSGR